MNDGQNVLQSTMKLLTILCFAVAAGAASPLGAQEVTVVPEGNRHVEQPDIPGASTRRTAANKTSFDAKYQKVLALLRTDKALRGKIEEAAEQFAIDPVHIAGAIIGEHTYNVDVYDRLQTYYVKAVSYVSRSIRFEHDGEDVSSFVEKPQFTDCAGKEDSYTLWTCRERVWNTLFRGRDVGGVLYPDDRFSAVFFQPFYAGQTFGIGQLNPLTALKMSDTVADVTGTRRLDVDDPNSIYETIMDPDKTLPYVAATLKVSIDAYRDIAGFDISENPGITATLYNTGDPEKRARVLKEDNIERAEAGEEPRLPEENYYGWLVNDRLSDLQALFKPAQ